METEGSLLSWQVHATYPYPKPDQSNPCPPSHFLKIHLNIILPSTPWRGLFPSGFPNKTPYALSFPSYVLHAPLITFSIWSPEWYLVWNTYH
jgi:hypothetical protein